MPKRPLDTSSTLPTGTDRVPPVKVQKTERSHEENQERAYIAASRRADRSLEARVQSAKMASEIHRRRTGKGLKVSEEIVIKEEMYEEEEDDLPRHYRYLTAHLQTNSPDMNSRVSAYITTQAAMATMARYNEINRLFSESFPTAQQYQQQMAQLNQSMYIAPLLGNNGGQQSTGPYSPIAMGSPTQASPVIRSQSVSSQAQLRRMSTTSNSTPNQTAVSSPPALTPGSHSTDLPETRNTPYQTPSAQFTSIPQPPHQSIFTSELPPEVKMMTQIDMNDPMASHFLGGNYPMFGDMGSTSSGKDFAQSVNSTTSVDEGSSIFDTDQNSSTPVAFPSNEFSAGHLEIPEDFSGLTATQGGPAENWDAFVDFGSEQ